MDVREPFDQLPPSHQIRTQADLLLIRSYRVDGNLEQRRGMTQCSTACARHPNSDAEMTRSTLSANGLVVEEGVAPHEIGVLCARRPKSNGPVLPWRRISFRILDEKLGATSGYASAMHLAED